MATIETNDVGGTRGDLMEQLKPMIRAQPTAVTDTGEPLGMGWLRDLPDFRDYTVEDETVKPQLEAIGAADAEAVSIPARIALRPYCSPIEDQGSIGSWTRTAAGGGGGAPRGARAAAGR